MNDALTAERLQTPSQGISILTAAQRKNACQTDVVCMGNNTKQIIAIETITKLDDPCAEQHELFGTKRIYASLDAKGIKIAKHYRDDNVRVPKFIREEKKSVLDPLAIWYGLENMEQSMKAIGLGTEKDHGVTWHKELRDKAHAIRMHASHALANRDIDTETFKELLLIPVTHYTNQHERCLLTSRCQIDKNYEPSKIIITDEKAKNLLETAIKQSFLYSNAESFLQNMSNAWVESFINTLGQFQDKHIPIDDDTYSTKTQLAVCHWNESVANNSLSPTLNYCQIIWQSYAQNFS